MTVNHWITKLTGTYVGGYLRRNMLGYFHITLLHAHLKLAALTNAFDAPGMKSVSRAEYVGIS